MDYEFRSLTIDKNKVMDREVGNLVETQDSRSLKDMSMPEPKPSNFIKLTHRCQLYHIQISASPEIILNPI